MPRGGRKKLNKAGVSACVSCVWRSVWRINPEYAFVCVINAAGLNLLRFIYFFAAHCKRMRLEHLPFSIRADRGYGVAHFW